MIALMRAVGPWIDVRRMDLLVASEIRRSERRLGAPLASVVSARARLVGVAAFERAGVEFRGDGGHFCDFARRAVRSAVARVVGPAP